MNNIAALVFAGLATAAIVLGVNQLRYREITWKEFINNYLARGAVESLEVVNKRYVRVKFAPGAQATSGGILWFNIGSVDAFERNLENIQLEMNVEPANYVPVIYKNEMELFVQKCYPNFSLNNNYFFYRSNILSILPNLLFLAFLVWTFRKTTGFIGRAKGGRGIFGVGETTAKLTNPADIGVTFRYVNLSLPS